MVVSVSQSLDRGSEGFGVDPLTNVLERFEQSKRSSGQSSALIIIAAILALPLGMLLGPFGPIVWLFSVVILTLLLLTAVHELGHLAVAWIAGFHIEQFVVGPLAGVRNGNSFRLAHNRIKGFGGYVAAVPSDPDSQTGWLIAYCAAGAAANLIVGVIAFVGYLMTPTALLSYAVVLPFAIFSAMFAIIGLIPIRLGAVETDGRTILNLLRTGPEATRTRAVWRLSALTRQKQRPREWDTASVESALYSADGSFTDTGGSYMAYLHHLDAGRNNESAQNIERSIANLGRLPLSLSSAYFVEAAYFYVLRGSSPLLARDILTRVDMAFVDDASRLRAEAAVLLAEGHTNLAVETAQRAIVLADATAELGIARFERDLAQRLIDIAESNEALLFTR